MSIKTMTGRDIAILIPTKDRPGKIKNLLNSLAQQTEKCGQIIIVDGGISVEEIVMGFSDRLPVEYYHCHPPGQIRQQNMGITHLDEHKLLVGFIDDDIVFDGPDALASMVKFWNQCPDETAGIACNMTNVEPYTSTWIKRWFMVHGTRPGQILPSGMNTSLASVSENIRTEWLPGGVTFWRTDIIKSFKKDEIYAKRALCEDLLFSYPIGKKYPLYVCHQCRVRHEHVFDHTSSQKERYYARTEVLWRMYLVTLHDDLHQWRLVLMYFALLVGDVLRGILHLNPNHNFLRAVGTAEGLFLGLMTIFKKRNFRDLLEERP